MGGGRGGRRAGRVRFSCPRGAVSAPRDPSPRKVTLILLRLRLHRRTRVCCPASHPGRRDEPRSRLSPRRRAGTADLRRPRALPVQRARRADQRPGATSSPTPCRVDPRRPGWGLVDGVCVVRGGGRAGLCVPGGESRILRLDARREGDRLPRQAGGGRDDVALHHRARRRRGAAPTRPRDRPRGVRAPARRQGRGLPRPREEERRRHDADREGLRPRGARGGGAAGAGLGRRARRGWGGPRARPAGLGLGAAARSRRRQPGRGARPDAVGRRRVHDASRVDFVALPRAARAHWHRRARGQTRPRSLEPRRRAPRDDRGRGSARPVGGPVDRGAGCRRRPEEVLLAGWAGHPMAFSWVDAGSLLLLGAVGGASRLRGLSMRRRVARRCPRKPGSVGGAGRLDRAGTDGGARRAESDGIPPSCSLAGRRGGGTETAHRLEPGSPASIRWARRRWSATGRRATGRSWRAC